MISYKEFIDYMDYYSRFDSYINKLADLNVNIWETEEVSTFTNNYISLIQELLNDTKDRLSYFMYDCDWGDNPNVVTDEGEYITLSNLKDVYDLIAEDNK